MTPESQLTNNNIPRGLRPIIGYPIYRTTMKMTNGLQQATN